MSDFWPSGLDLGDTHCPMDILREAQSDWETNSNGMLALLLQRAKSKTENDMVIVHVKHVRSNRTGSLFSVVHRPNAPYPVTIFPKDAELPKFLRKSYYEPPVDVFGGISSSVLGVTKGKNVENEWVADTPAEFRQNLRDVFNLGVVKSVVLNLFASESVSPGDAVGEGEEGVDPS
ncbi:hypothetical protein Pla175_00060 [Pirellulimonas nuda]|uniref:Uncharacterized protein n=1 Tax=Pirellulimonas nuda TaxID=2528009 RepID=A0A518D5B2_9BACT|nr:hypothetical protein [Pirellulimonas nuda]QDU86656.1 hypothetical protein Pla175_00060 [Pirellulimonas nuda]